jgi:hypothetical protein
MLSPCLFCWSVNYAVSVVGKNLLRERRYPNSRSAGIFAGQNAKKDLQANAVNPSMLVAGAGFEPTTFGL